ncbi:MAG: acyl carrier protein [Rhodobacteraceae bacterium]|nr:acyl carrier protein [Paracoccaceae bacterium]
MKDDIRSFIIGSLLNGKSVGDAEDLLLSGMVDSLGVMRLVRHLEQTHDISIPAEDVVIENFVSIDAVATYLDTRRAA